MQRISAFSASCSDLHLKISLEKRVVMYQSAPDKTMQIQAVMYVARNFRLCLKYKKKTLNYEISPPAPNQEGKKKSTDQNRTKKLERFHSQCLCRILDLRWQMNVSYVEIVERSLSTSIESLLLQWWLWGRVMRSGRRTTGFKTTFYTVYCHKKKRLFRKQNH